MRGMFGIYARRLLIEKISRTGDHFCIDGEPLLDRQKRTLPIDVDTFGCIGYGFFKDKYTIYGLTYTMTKNTEKYFFTPLKHADLDTFEPISMLYGKDKNGCYFAEGGKTIKENHVRPLIHYTNSYQDENFPHLKATHTWSSDIALGQDFVYNRGMKIKDADAGTFEQIGQYYYRDAHRIYMANGYSIKALENIDAPSFIVLSDASPGMATDLYQPLICYRSQSRPEEWFAYYRKYFEARRGQISEDYWWYKLEQTMKKDL
nr:DKNYY domain-containing protein [Taibaiella koreensis]